MNCPSDDCDQYGIKVRGMCRRHYQMWFNKTPPEQRGLPPRLAGDFDDFVQKSDDGCWIWTGRLCPKGYGRWPRSEFSQLAHRIMLDRYVPCPDPALFACHHCDNPPCVNPAHLYWGTVQDNNRDRDARGRNPMAGKLQTHCKRGHEMTEDNVVTNKGRRGRLCKACRDMRNRAQYLKTKEVA